MKWTPPTTAFPIDTTRAETAPSIKRTLLKFGIMLVLLVSLLDVATKNGWGISKDPRKARVFLFMRVLLLGL
jgi:hypothetical protein